MSHVALSVVIGFHDCSVYFYMCSPISDFCARALFYLSLSLSLSFSLSFVRNLMGFSVELSCLGVWCNRDSNTGTSIGEKRYTSYQRHKVEDIYPIAGKILRNGVSYVSENRKDQRPSVCSDFRKNLTTVTSWIIFLIEWYRFTFIFEFIASKSGERLSTRCYHVLRGHFQAKYCVHIWRFGLPQIAPIFSSFNRQSDLIKLVAF
jgi:hypothetical protein